jgi:sec-independent protein translocase protein TatB
MFDLGTQELIVIFIVAFLVFGPKRLPELGRTLGKGMRELKSAMRGVKDSIEEAGSDVTDEIKEAKADLEKSIAKDFDFIDSPKEEASKEKSSKPGDDQSMNTEEESKGKSSKPGDDQSMNTEEESKGKKENNKDG